MPEVLFIVREPVTFFNCNVVVADSNTEGIDELKLACTVVFGCVFGTLDTVGIEPALLFSWSFIVVDVLEFV